MRNLAGVVDCDRSIRSELQRCGIPTIDVPKAAAEVPYSVIGRLKFGDHKFSFTRAWYYWCVAGRVPLAIAEELYADPVGVTDIRVSGHAGCPKPSEWITWWRPDERTVVPTKEEPEFQRLRDKGFLAEANWIFSDDPASLGFEPFIDSYHIDSELGLYLFANMLKKRLGAY